MCARGAELAGKMSVKLFADIMSQPARAVLLFCRANRNFIPFTLKPVALRKCKFWCSVDVGDDDAWSNAAEFGVLVTDSACQWQSSTLK